MTHVSHVNDVPVVYEEPGPNWVRLERDLTRPPTTKAMPFRHEGLQIWIAKANCQIYRGCYYAKTFALESAKAWAEAARRNT